MCGVLERESGISEQSFLPKKEILSFKCRYKLKLERKMECLSYNFKRDWIRISFLKKKSVHSICHNMSGDKCHKQTQWQLLISLRSSLLKNVWNMNSLIANEVKLNWCLVSIKFFLCASKNEDVRPASAICVHFRTYTSEIELHKILFKISALKVCCSSRQSPYKRWWMIRKL